MAPTVQTFLGYLREVAQSMVKWGASAIEDLGWSDAGSTE